jgi:CRISPR/Cas system CSM-associated protein Csm4 (group 5 of RAMP superfamily)
MTHQSKSASKIKGIKAIESGNSDYMKQQLTISSTRIAMAEDLLSLMNHQTILTKNGIKKRSWKNIAMSQQKQLQSILKRQEEIKQQLNEALDSKMLVEETA